MPKKPQRIQRLVFTSYITYFRRAVYRKFQFKKFSNLDITKKLAKKNFFQLPSLFHPSENTGFFSEAHKNKLKTNC